MILERKQIPLLQPDTFFMEKETGYFEKTEQLVQDYLQNRLLLLKLQGTEKASRLASAMVIFLVVLLLSFLILIFISMMGGYYFADLTGSLFYGFGIVTGIYVILLVIVFALRKKYLNPLIANTVVKILFDKHSDHEQVDTEHTE